MRSAWTGGQYSLFRVLLGSYLCVHFAHLLPWATELFSSAGVLPDGALSPLFASFPSLYAISDAPAFVQCTLLLAAFAALAFAAGWHDRVAALAMWLILASLYVRNPLIANPSLPYVGFMLLAHVFMAPAPYGSVAARGRADLAQDWRPNRGVFVAAWIVLALSYSYSGWTKLLSPSWVAGDNVAFVLENPLARDWWLRDLVLAAPSGLVTGLTWFILYLELLFAPLALWKRARPWIWTGMLVVQLGFLLLLNFADLTFGMLLFHLFTFDPAWVRGRRFADDAVLYFDGRCALCHGFVRFVLAEERTRTLRFAPLQGARFAQAVPADVRAGLPDSIVLDLGDGRRLVRSDAVVEILLRMGGLWRLLGAALRAVPRVVRDVGYDAVGGLRYRLFGAAPDLCPVAGAAVRSRLLEP